MLISTSVGANVRFPIVALRVGRLFWPVLVLAGVPANASASNESANATSGKRLQWEPSVAQGLEHRIRGWKLPAAVEKAALRALERTQSIGGSEAKLWEHIVRGEGDAAWTTVSGTEAFNPDGTASISGLLGRVERSINADPREGGIRGYHPVSWAVGLHRPATAGRGYRGAAPRSVRRNSVKIDVVENQPVARASSGVISNALGHRVFIVQESLSTSVIPSMTHRVSQIDRKYALNENGALIGEVVVTGGSMVKFGPLVNGETPSSATSVSADKYRDWLPPGLAWVPRNQRPIRAPRSAE